MIKSLSILALTIISLLPLKLYSAMSETDTLKMNDSFFKIKDRSVINTINKDYVIRVKKGNRQNST